MIESVWFNNNNVRNQFEAKLKELEAMPIIWADKDETVAQDAFEKLAKQYAFLFHEKSMFNFFLKSVGSFRKTIRL